VIGSLVATLLVALGVLWRVDWTGCGTGALVHTSQGFHVNLGDNLRIRFSRFPWGAFAFGAPERTEAAGSSRWRTRRSSCSCC
jgi:hypothetical protein